MVKLSAHMHSEGCGSCPLCVCVCVCFRGPLRDKLDILAVVSLVFKFGVFRIIAFWRSYTFRATRGTTIRHRVIFFVCAFINPRRACAARVSTCFVCLSVCLSVTAVAATAFVSTCNERHLRHYYRLFLGFNSWNVRQSIPFKSYGVICK